MAIDIKVPSVGESITEGSIARWIKKNGDLVRIDEPIFELETEKASTEVPSPAAGKLLIKSPEGAKVAIGAVVGSIDPADVPAAKPAATEKTAKPAQDASPATSPLSPSASRLAKEEGLDPAQIAGSGRRGMILKDDVQKVVDVEKTVRTAPAAAPPSTAVATTPAAVPVAK